MAAAEEAIARLPCWGEDAVYRAVAALQRSYFDPPSFDRARWDIGQESHSSKLKNAPPIARSAANRVRHYRKRER
jgi:hypothetical protein